MKLKWMVVATMFLTTTVCAVESQAPERLAGLWVTESQSRTSSGQACRVSFELVDGSRVIRTAGELVYSTTVVFNPKGRGWELNELLEQHNGRQNCFGRTAEEVVAHLSKPAYIELQRGVLKYYRSASDTVPVFRFIPARAGVAAGSP